MSDHLSHVDSFQFNAARDFDWRHQVADLEQVEPEYALDSLEDFPVDASFRAIAMFQAHAVPATNGSIMV